MHTINSGSPQQSFSLANSREEIPKNTEHTENTVNTESTELSVHNPPVLSVIEKRAKRLNVRKIAETSKDRFANGIKELIHYQMAMWMTHSFYDLQHTNAIQKKNQTEKDKSEIERLKEQANDYVEKFNGCLEQLEWALAEFKRLKVLESDHNQGNEDKDGAQSTDFYTESLQKLEKYLLVLNVDYAPSIVSLPVPPAKKTKLPIKQHEKINALKSEIVRAEEIKEFLERVICFSNENNKDNEDNKVNEDYIKQCQTECDALVKKINENKKIIQNMTGMDMLEVERIRLEKGRKYFSIDSKSIKYQLMPGFSSYCNAFLEDMKKVEKDFNIWQEKYLNNDIEIEDVEIYQNYLGSWCEWKKIQQRLYIEAQGLFFSKEGVSSLIMNMNMPLDKSPVCPEDFSWIQISHDECSQIAAINWMKEKINKSKDEFDRAWNIFLVEKNPDEKKKLVAGCMALKENLEKMQKQYIKILLDNEKVWKDESYREIFDINEKRTEMYGVMSREQALELKGVHIQYFSKFLEMAGGNETMKEKLKIFSWNAKLLVYRILHAQLTHIESLESIEEAKEFLPEALQVPIKIPTISYEWGNIASEVREERKKAINAIHSKKYDWIDKKTQRMISERTNASSQKIKENTKDENRCYKEFCELAKKTFDLDGKLSRLNAVNKTDSAKKITELSRVMKEILNELYEEKCLMYMGEVVYIPIFEKASFLYWKFEKYGRNKRNTVGDAHLDKVGEETRKSNIKELLKEDREEKNGNLKGNLNSSRNSSRKNENIRQGANTSSEKIRNTTVRNTTVRNTTVRNTKEIKKIVQIEKIEKNVEKSTDRRTTNDEEDLQAWIPVKKAPVKKAPPRETEYMAFGSNEKRFLRDLTGDQERGEMLENLAVDITHWSQDCMGGDKKIVLTGKEGLALVDWFMYSTSRNRTYPLIRNPLHLENDSDLYDIYCDYATGEFAGSPAEPNVHIKFCINNGKEITSKHHVDQNGKGLPIRPTMHILIKPEDMQMVKDGLNDKLGGRKPN